LDRKCCRQKSWHFRSHFQSENGNKYSTWTDKEEIPLPIMALPLDPPKGIRPQTPCYVPTTMETDQCIWESDMYLYLQDDGPASSLASDGHIVLIIPIICIFETVDSLYIDNTLMNKRQERCGLQVKLCNPCMSALYAKWLLDNSRIHQLADCQLVVSTTRGLDQSRSRRLDNSRMPLAVPVFVVIT